MTRRLYYEDAYRKRFYATVTGCEAENGRFRVLLSQTAFYPEGGGQPADGGSLDQAQVLDVREEGEEVVHYTDQPLAVGETVEGTLDWPRRRSFMQQHTGEHIVSGIVHMLFGLDNVGFHMGHDAVTIDFNGELGEEELRQVETLANKAVWKNLPVKVNLYAASEAKTLAYRSKKELEGQVRIVTIPDCDVCACCGTHLNFTGEVGMIKLVDSQRYKGGIRIWLMCGVRALEDYGQKNSSVYDISAQLSAKPGEVADAVRRLSAENEALKQQLAATKARLYEQLALQVEEGATYACLFEEGMEPQDLRRCCTALCGRCTAAAVFSDSGDGGWRYALGSEKADVRPLGKLLNETFHGRGGGTETLVQGSLTGSKQEIETFFRERT